MDTPVQYCPPHGGFRPAGQVVAAHFCTPPSLTKRRLTGRRLQGVRYEKKAQEYLQERLGEGYVNSPWIRFLADGKWRWCQPDGILFKPREGRIVIVEVKYQHTSDAWWQLRHLYQPVLEAIFPRDLWRYEVCELVKWFDPATPFPEKTVFAHEVDMMSHGFKVHIWRP